jgi:hypothetical protein
MWTKGQGTRVKGKRDMRSERWKERRNRSTERERNEERKIYKERERNRDDYLKD